MMKLVTLFLTLVVALVSVQGFDIPDYLGDIIEDIKDTNKCDFCPSGSSCIDVNGMKECKCDGSGEIVPPHGFGTAFCDECGPNQELKEYSHQLFSTAFCICADGYQWNDAGDACVSGDPCEGFNCPFNLKCKNFAGIPVCGV